MAKSSWNHALIWASLAGALAGCSTVPDSHAPASPPPLNPLASADSDSGEPVPQVEPPSRSGNPDTYVVFGRRYRVKETSEGYREEGIASWYGWDFHGRKTSSGPPYNMFDLTAAHKSLPIPTYVRVTNLENGRNVVVKVNDRGPFVGRRIIDLSYAAADRLDMLGQGTAQVEVVALEPYQSLPELAARRAEVRERLASRQNRSEPAPEPAEPAMIAMAALEPQLRSEPATEPAEPARVQFAREAPIRPAVGGKPPARLASRATEERHSSQNRPVRLAAATVERNAPKSTARRLANAKSPTRDNERDRASTNIRLAFAVQASAKGAVEERRIPTSVDHRNGKLSSTKAVAERKDVRPSRDRVSSPARRDSRKESGASSRQEAQTSPRNPGGARPTAIRLAGLKVSRSRVATD